MSSKLDKNAVRDGYEDVRNDSTDTLWVVFKYDGDTIQTSAKGSDFDDFKTQFGDKERGFGFLRVTTGDELSKRSKFALVTWTGEALSPVQKARMGPDKMLIKSVIQNFAYELHTSDINEVNLDHISEEVRKAGGANYGTGSRD